MRQSRVLSGLVLCVVETLALHDALPGQVHDSNYGSAQIQFDNTQLHGRSVKRGGYQGWGVNMEFGERSIEVHVLDIEGHGFFELASTDNETFCRFHVGHDQRSSGVSMQVFEQKGLECRLDVYAATAADRLIARVVSLSVAGGGADCLSPSFNPCPPVMRWEVGTSEPFSANVRDVIIGRATITFDAKSVSAQRAQRGDDLGWGVDMAIHQGSVQASVLDTDGDGFFGLFAENGAFCKVDVGSDGEAPGLKVEVFEQKGLMCKFEMRGKDGAHGYDITVITMVSTEKDSDCFTPSIRSCPPGFYPDRPALLAGEGMPFAGKLLDEVVGSAQIKFDAHSVTARRAQRGNDRGWGVDMAIYRDFVTASVLDIDGDAFFELVAKNGSFCKVDVGSDGPLPGLRVEVYEQKGLLCDFETLREEREHHYVITVLTSVPAKKNLDCLTPSSHSCAPAFHPFIPPGRQTGAKPSGGLNKEQSHNHVDSVMLV